MAIILLILVGKIMFAKQEKLRGIRSTSTGSISLGLDHININNYSSPNRIKTVIRETC